MKSMLILISFLIGSPLFAQTPKPLKCTFSVQHQCNADKCTSVVPKVWVELDVAKAKYSRCDSKGCDTYDLDAAQSGVFINFRSKANNGLTAKLDEKGNFVETASIMLQTNVSYGVCKGAK